MAVAATTSLVESAPEFRPFYERLAGGGPWSLSRKFVISLGLGALFLGTSKLLVAIISCAMLAQFYATHTFHGVLPFMRLKLGPAEAKALAGKVQEGLGDRRLLTAGLFFGVFNTLVGAYLGPPYSGLHLAYVYSAYFVAGVVCGVPAGGILGGVLVFHKFVALKPRLDFTDPDLCGGTAVFGRALVRFSAVTMGVGVLISCYLLRTHWLRGGGAMLSFELFWVLWPFLLALAVLMIPAHEIGERLREVRFAEASALDRRLASLEAEIEDVATRPDAREQARASYAYYRDLRGDLYQMRTLPFRLTDWGHYAASFALSFALAWTNADLKHFRKDDLNSSVLSRLTNGHGMHTIELVAEALGYEKQGGQ